MNLQNKFNIFKNEYGYKGIFALILYPLITIVTTPIQLVKTMWNSRILFQIKDWNNFTNYQVHKAINYLFYKTIELNLSRHGRTGISQHMGLGNHDMKQFFHYSMPALKGYSKFGIVFVLCSMIFYLLIHLLWITQVDTFFCITIIFLAFICTTFYANIFGHQNYNAMGWAFFPIYLYGLLNHKWMIASIGLFLTSFGSITVLASANILSLFLSVTLMSFAPIVATIPANIKFLFHFYPFINKMDISALNDILKILGLQKNNVKYIRLDTTFLKSPDVFLGLPYVLLMISNFIIIHKISYLLLFGLIILLFNMRFRFADIQSMQMLMLSIATSVVLNSRSYFLIPFFWIAISPPAIFLEFPSINHILVTVPSLSPFNIKKIISRMNSFLEPVVKNKRVLICFNDPRGNYSKIFDGFRTLLEPLLYAAAIKEIHCMPDWWGVSRLNYAGAPDFWGREPNQVIKNIKYWNIDYVIIYQIGASRIEDKWLNAGFCLKGSLSWDKLNLRNIKPYVGEIPPDWFLLEYHEENSHNHIKSYQKS